MKIIKIISVVLFAVYFVLSIILAFDWIGIINIGEGLRQIIGVETSFFSFMMVLVILSDSMLSMFSSEKKVWNWIVLISVAVVFSMTIFAQFRDGAWLGAVLQIIVVMLMVSCFVIEKKRERARWEKAVEGQ